VNHFCEVPDAWPIGVGHPCYGCTEKKFAFRVPLHQTIDVEHLTPPDTYAPINAEHEYRISPVATGVAGFVGGALLGAGYVASKILRGSEGSGSKPSESKEESK
jgi:hydrogenase small subunit